MQSVKKTTQVEAVHDGQVILGYEIHMGTTVIGSDVKPFSTIIEENGNMTERQDGAISYGGQVQGTYLHGVFDNLEWTRNYLNEIRLEKNLKPMEDVTVSFEDYKDKEYNKLSDILRNSLDITYIYKIINGEA